MRKIATYLLYPNTLPSNLENVASDLPLGSIPPLKGDYESGWVLFSFNECPVTMLITDPFGRRIGTTPDGQNMNEIPGAIYTGHDTGLGPDMLWFPEPASGVYTVTIAGLKADFFQISIGALSPTSEQRLGIFTGRIEPGQILTYTTTAFTPTPTRRLLLVDDSVGSANSASYITSLTNLGRPPKVWDVTQQGLPSVSDLYPYDTVVWTTGDSSLSQAAAVALWTYVQYGGAVLLTGQNVDSGIDDTTILSSTLRAKITNAAVTSRSITGDDLLAGLTLHLNGGDSANNQDSPSAIAPLPNTVTLGQYIDGTGAHQEVGLRYATNYGQLVYLAFGIEGLQSNIERTETLNRLLHWLETGTRPASNTPPIISFIEGANNPINVSSATANVTVHFTDAGASDMHRCTFDWGDGSTPTQVAAEGVGNGSCSAVHTYTEPDVYSVQATVSDQDGAADQERFQDIIVYDPNAGFVTGGGWITSPVGVYSLQPELNGKAHFNVVARYAQGAHIPDGLIEFKFQAAALKFQSTSYQWLVISGAKAQVQGIGSINGSGVYDFILTLIDGQAQGGGKSDAFRLKIWDRVTGSIIYDTQQNATITADPTTTLGGGSIVIHRF